MANKLPKNPPGWQPFYKRHIRALVFGGGLALVGGLLIWRSFAATPLAATSADLNGDGKVNLSDLSILLTNYDKTNAAKGDINGDGSVNLTDLSILLSQFGSTVGGGVVDASTIT